MHVARSFVPRFLGLMLVASLVASAVVAHPGAGIVVDRLGQVFFVDTGLGVWKIDLEGRLVRHDGPAYHWLTIDHGGGFARVRLARSLARDVTIVGGDPTLLLGGDFPLTIGADGALYHPRAQEGAAVRMIRRAPGGGETVFATLPEAFETGPGAERVRAPWIHGLAAGADGSLFYTERDAVRRIAPDGAVSLIAGSVTVPDCVYPPAITDERLAPSLRGLDLGPDGSVYVAASACSAVLKIAPTGSVSVVLWATEAWSPMGVAVSDGDLYVLEYRYIPTDRREDWLPRVRKLGQAGKVTILATVTQR